MGDRVSIQFRNSKDPEWMRDSVVLFNHWGGMEFVVEAQAFADRIKEHVSGPCMEKSGPFGRREAAYIMVEFIRQAASIHMKDGHLGRSLYLGATPSDGDNSDNGHHIIELS